MLPAASAPPLPPFPSLSPLSPLLPLSPSPLAFLTTASLLAGVSLPIHSPHVKLKVREAAVPRRSPPMLYSPPLLRAPPSAWAGSTTSMRSTSQELSRPLGSRPSVRPMGAHTPAANGDALSSSLSFAEGVTALAPPRGAHASVPKRKVRTEPRAKHDDRSASAAAFLLPMFSLSSLSPPSSASISFAAPRRSGRESHAPSSLAVAPAFW